MRIEELHPYLLVMSQLCYYYINPHYTSKFIRLNEQLFLKILVRRFFIILHKIMPLLIFFYVFRFFPFFFFKEKKQPKR